MYKYTFFITMCIRTSLSVHQLSAPALPPAITPFRGLALRFIVGYEPRSTARRVHHVFVGSEGHGTCDNIDCRTHFQEINIGESRT